MFPTEIVPSAVAIEPEICYRTGGDPGHRMVEGLVVEFLADAPHSPMLLCVDKVCTSVTSYILFLLFCYV